MPMQLASKYNMPPHKRRRKQGSASVPPIPPKVSDEDVEISDEDVEFVRTHEDYAGFLDKLDTKNITRHVLGLKPSHDEDDLETYYEKGAKRENNFAKHLSLDPVDVLPVRTLAGDLRYGSTSTEAAVDGSFVSLDERRSLVVKGPNSNISQEISIAAVQKAHSGQADHEVEKKEEKVTAVERTEEKRKAKQMRRNQEKKQAERGIEQRLVPSDSEQDLDRESKLKARMAEIGTGLFADPDNNIMTLKELQDMCIDRDESVAQLAMLSSMAIFKDLIPGYRIRLPSSKEMGMTVSKEVQNLRDYETALLRFYQAYVQMLVRSAKVRSMRRTALRCLCGLLEAVPHFNYRDSILAAVVPRMNSDDDDFSNMSCEAVAALFKNPGKHGGEATVEAVQLIAELVRLRNCHLRPEVVKVFLGLTFDDDLSRDSRSGAVFQRSLEGDQKIGHKLSKQQEKKAKKLELASQLRKEVRADFEEASAAPEVMAQKKLQTLTLSSVFEIYFRILKRSLDPEPARASTLSKTIDICGKQPGTRPLLQSCLEGLSKFSHLINVDFMADLLGALHALARGGIPSSESLGTTVSMWERLQCCTVAFQIVRMHMDALNIDLQEFYTLFYNLLLETISIRGENTGETLAEALQIMLWEGGHSDMSRVAAFVKRLSTLALHLPSGEAMAVLATVQHLLVRYKKCRSMLENNGGVGYPGSSLVMFQSEEDNPDLSGAQSTVLWELSLLAQHYNPEVSKHAAMLLSLNQSSSMTLPTVTPTSAVREFSPLLKAVVVAPKGKRKKGTESIKSHSMFLKSTEERCSLHFQDDLPSAEFIRSLRRLFYSHFKEVKAPRKQRKTMYLH